MLNALVQIGVSTRSVLGLFCAWSGSELVSSSVWSGSELVSLSAWSGSELGSFKCLAVSTASSLDRGASVWIVLFGSVCGSEQSSSERGSACLRETVRVREKWKMFEVKIWAEIDFRWFLLILRSN